MIRIAPLFHNFRNPANIRNPQIYCINRYFLMFGGYQGPISYHEMCIRDSIGGSITEGALAKPNSMCYAEVSAKTFGVKYGKNNGENVHFINAGMSGTPSDIGVVRYNRDAVSYTHLDVYKRQH